MGYYYNIGHIFILDEKIICFLTAEDSFGYSTTLLLLSGSLGKLTSYNLLKDIIRLGAKFSFHVSFQIE